MAGLSNGCEVQDSLYFQLGIAKRTHVCLFSQK